MNPTLNSSDNSNKSLAQIQIFGNPEFGSVRTIEENGKILFCGSDVAKSLGYSKPSDAISAHCRYTAKYSIPHPQSINKSIEMSFIPEGDVYRLITSSKLKSAQKFESWVFDEVLPSIRKNGLYSLPKTFSEALQLAADQAKMIEEQQKVISIQQPKAEYYDSFADSSKLIEIGHLGKVTGIGSRNIFPLLVGKKIIYKKTVDGISYYEPYYDYEKYFKSVERTFCNPEGETKHRPQLYLTSKGFIHFQTLLSKTIEETADKWIEKEERVFSCNKDILTESVISDTAGIWMDAEEGAKKEAEKVLDSFKNDRKFAAGVEGAKHVLWGD